MRGKGDQDKRLTRDYFKLLLLLLLLWFWLAAPRNTAFTPTVTPITSPLFSLLAVGIVKRKYYLFLLSPIFLVQAAARDGRLDTTKRKWLEKKRKKGGKKG